MKKEAGSPLEGKSQMHADYRLMDLLDRIRSDPSNAGYLLLLKKYTREEIERALTELGL